MPFALAALFVVVGAIAALAYAINAWQVYGFARHVWHLPQPLSLGASGVADALSLAGLFATYLLRNAKWSVRAYAWVVFLTMTGLSIAAAESFAAWRRMTPAQQEAGEGYGAQVAAGAIVVALALAVHLLIVVRRHVPIDTEPVAPAPARPVAAPAEAPAAPPVAAQLTRTPPPARRPRSVTPSKAVTTDRDAVARRVVEQGARPADLAPQVGVTKRSIESWVRDYRERHTPRLGSFDPGPLDGIRDRHVNGTTPEIGVST